ncbi:GxxExxY protein [bacterium]|nr:GxxExxY protein [bacterium]
MQLLCKDESCKIIGACFEVYEEKGNGFIEEVYQECLCIEFEPQSVPFIAKPELELAHKDRILT